MKLLFPMMTLDTAILWSVIDPLNGREVWSQMLDVGIDPMPYAVRCLTEAPKLCACDSQEVIAAQERGFL